jgi:hypothetical protein
MCEWCISSLGPPLHDMCAQKVGERMKMELVEKYEIQVK